MRYAILRVSNVIIFIIRITINYNCFLDVIFVIKIAVTKITPFSEREREREREGGRERLATTISIT